MNNYVHIRFAQFLPAYGEKFTKLLCQICGKTHEKGTKVYRWVAIGNNKTQLVYLCQMCHDQVNEKTYFIIDDLEFEICFWTPEYELLI